MPSLYRIYFSRDSTVLSLPINPEKLPETKESDNGEYNVLGLGPVMQPRTPKLRKVTISGLFPGRRLPWMSAAVFLPPSVYITFFKSAMDQKRPIVYTPVRYYENGTPFLGGGMGFECLVTSFKTEERGGETGDECKQQFSVVPKMKGASHGTSRALDRVLVYIEFRQGFHRYEQIFLCVHA